MDTDRRFTDVAKALQPYFDGLLTLIHLDGRWQIIAKVFHYEEQARPA